MSFFSKLFGIVKKVAPIAIGFALGGPAGAAIGGAAGSALRGGDIGQILQGGMIGYGAGGGLNLLSNSAKILQAGGSLQGLAGGLGSMFNPLSAAGSSGASGLFGGNPLLSLANIGGNLYSAQAGKSAAKKAAALQAASVNKAIEAQKATLAQATANVQPYLTAGETTAPGLTQLINDPNAQRAFIQNNPFYDALANDAKSKLFANAAAKGKLGSGGTAEALQNSLLLLGDRLLSQDISRKQDLVGLGASTASGLNAINQSGTSNITDLITSGGTAKSAGVIGGYNAQSNALNNLLSTQAAIYGIDKGIRI